jgi:hypothetical protein
MGEAEQKSFWDSLTEGVSVFVQMVEDQTAEIANTIDTIMNDWNVEDTNENEAKVLEKAKSFDQSLFEKASGELIFSIELY